MAADKPLLDQKKFLTQYRFTEQDLEQSRLSWKDLASIYTAHAEDVLELQATADYVSQRLRQLPEVHSLKIRVKDPEHLLAKIIRKMLKDPVREITPDNYSEEITDLIGIRAMHLFKEQWAPIHDFVTRTWDLKEKPIAYVREGDSEPILTKFSQCGCVVEKHAFGYRSVHYLLTSRPTKSTHTTELQVRTPFEEAWSEIDHQIRYPDLTEDPRLAEFLTIFNRFAGSADEMGTFIKVLRDHLAEQAARVEEVESRLKKAISQLEISDAEKTKLQEQVTELRKSSGPYSVIGTRLVGQGLLVPGLVTGSVTSGYPFDTLPGRGFCPSCGTIFKKEFVLGEPPSNVCPECRRRQSPESG